MTALPIISPLRVPKSKSADFILNLNHYRNAHFHTLNNAKKRYLNEIQYQVKSLPLYKKIKLIYTLYPKNKKLCDLDNVLSIHAKFFQDALVTLGRIPEDNYLCVVGSEYRFGAVDKINPRVEINIESVL